MKKLFFIAAVMSSAVLLAGCESLGLSGVKMDDAKAVTRVVDSYDTWVEDGYKPISIQWSEEEALSNKLGYMDLDMVNEEGVVYRRMAKIGGDQQGERGEFGPSKFHRKTYDYQTMHWLSKEDINADLVGKHYQAAREMIPEEYNFKSIDKYEIGIDPVSGEKSYKFSVNVTEKGNATEVSGNRIITNYYEVEFIGYSDGTVDLKD